MIRKILIQEIIEKSCLIIIFKHKSFIATLITMIFYERETKYDYYLCLSKIVI